MTKTYAQIASQIESLQRQAEAVRRKEVAGVVSRIKEAIEVYGLTAGDLGLATTPAAKSTTAKRSRSASKSNARAGKKLPVKYRDDAGNTWTGRGNRPRWLSAALSSGKKLEDFAV